MALCRPLRTLVAVGSTALVVASLSATPAQAAPPTGRNVIISNYVSNWYLSTDHQNVKPNQRVQIWDRDPMAHDGAGSIWRLTPRGDGTYSISPSTPYGAASSSCLTNEKDGKSGEGAVWVRECDNGDTRQAWRIRDVSSRSSIHTIVPVNNRAYALGPHRGRAANDTYVNVTRKQGHTPAAVQMWKINAA